jgi:hypothetical protein
MRDGPGSKSVTATQPVISNALIRKGSPLSILHIGYPKSASTSIQWNLFRNCEKHVYISRKNNGSTEASEKTYNTISEGILNGTPIKPIKTALTQVTQDAPFIFSDERILLHYGLKRTCLFKRAGDCRAIFGDVKVLMVIRNPVEQIRSLYKHVMINQYQDSKALPKENINCWLGKLDESRFWLPGDVTQGLYFGRLAALYASLFGKNNLHVVFFEEFVSKGPAAYVELANTLGLDDFKPPKEYVRMNSTADKSAFQEILAHPKSKYEDVMTKKTLNKLESILESEVKILESNSNARASASWREMALLHGA